MRDIKIKFRIILLAVIFFSFFALAESSLAAEELTTTQVTRISHPAFRMVNYGYGVRDLWNRDYTRVMLYESTSFVDPTTGERGRGLVWGTVLGLKSVAGGTVAAYKAAATPVPDQVHITLPTSANWSIFTGEENIIYASFYSGSNCSYLKKINVDTGVATNVTSINDAGVDCRTFTCYGWRASDNKLICSMRKEDWTSGGYVIDVQAGTKAFVSSAPPTAGGTCYQNPPYINNDGWDWPNWSSHGHSGRNPGLTYWLNNYGNGTYAGVINTKGAIKRSDCSVVSDTIGTTNHSTHVSWKASDNWFLTSTCGDDCTWHTLPYLDTFRLYKAEFNGSTFTYSELLSKQSAGRWETAPGLANHMNYQAIPIATLRKDGSQAVFMSTDGKYSYDDYLYNSISPWGTEGVFLADLVSGSGTTPPAAPQGLSVQ